MQQGFTAILLAAGSSRRMGTDKMQMIFGGKTPLERCVDAFSAAGVRHFVLAAGEENRESARALAARLENAAVVQGGAARGDSVFAALQAVQTEYVLIHDAARCLVTPQVIRAAMADAESYGSGVAAIPARDTAVLRDEGTLERDKLLLIQTPQAFRTGEICAAYARARREGVTATDDCTLYRLAGYEPHFSDGSLLNQKLTYPEDAAFFRAAAGERTRPRIGYGEDTHRFAEGRALVLGGVEIPFRLGLLGHSDADVLTHAIIDALLGAAALGDIGRHFPDTDPAYAGICSLELLSRVGALLEAAGYLVGNIDATILAQEPRLAGLIPQMQETIARRLGILPGAVSVKATTPEHTGPEGNLECISARAICLLASKI